MNLDREEQRMLDGELGEGCQKAMEIVVALGRIYGARALVKVENVHVSGVSYRNLGNPGLEFLENFARLEGSRSRVEMATLNPAGMDLISWKELGIPEEFAEKQERVVKAFEDMGIKPSCTCTPYLTGSRPGLGEHIAWSESSAVAYANSVLGARTNREGGPSALAAAITGRTAMYGYHLDENRKANFLVNVNCDVKSFSDFGALGCFVGREIGAGVPYFRGLRELDDSKLRALGAAMGAAGSVALYHVENLTPEAREQDVLGNRYEAIEVDDLREVYGGINNSESREIDLVAIGCPHTSLGEVEKVVSLMKGRKAIAEFWVCTSRLVKELAGKRGLVGKLDSSGVKLVADTCMVVVPMKELGFESIALNSGKASFYMPSYHGLKVHFGTLEQCVEAAVSGRWSPL
jgi:predicted aconitase